MKNYASELTDTEFKVIEKTLKDQRKRKYELQDLWNGIFYVLKTGCPWRYLSREYPPWKTVYYRSGGPLLYQVEERGSNRRATGYTARKREEKAWQRRQSQCRHH